MVSADELAFETAAGDSVDDVPIDLSVAIDHSTLSGEELVLGMYVEGVGLLLHGSQFAAQVFVVCPESELIGISGVVTEAVVDVVVGDAGSCPKGNLASEVWEEVESVVVVMLRDGQFAM